MENFGYLFAAYTVIWAVVFGFVLFMQRKQKQLEHQIKLLQEPAGKRKTREDT